MSKVKASVGTVLKLLCVVWTKGSDIQVQWFSTSVAQMQEGKGTCKGNMQNNGFYFESMI